MKISYFRHLSPKRWLGLIGGRAATFAAAAAVLAVASTVISPAAAEARPNGTEITATESSDLTQLSAAEMAAAIPAPTASPGSGLSSLANYNPRTSPAARQVRETGVSAPSCYTDYVCQKVPKTANCNSCGMREFLFYYFGLYRVSDWHEYGKYNNRQRNGDSYRTYRSDGSMIGCARAGRAGNNDLEPVHYVRLSPTPC